MCGVFFSNKPSEPSHTEISESLKLRGPDGSQALKFAELTMQFTRLAIRDLNGGDQPYLTADNTHYSAINGELYNEDFIRSSINYNSGDLPSGDMQLLGEYLSKDLNNIRNVEGMFGGYLLDIKNSKLSFFRDHVGEKPLYYYLDDEHITVSSTLMAIVEHHDLGNSKVNTEFFYKGHANPGQTIFKDIKEVCPGQIITIDLVTKRMSFQTYWNWPVRSQGKVQQRNIQEEFENVLRSSTEKCATSDVPICMLLSGGLDSAAVLSALNETRDVGIPGFTIAFEDNSFDESLAASKTAAALGSEHFVFRLKNSECAEFLQTAIDKLDTPILDPAYLPLFILSKKIREEYGFKVGITGDGGDEILRGYDLFKVRPIIEKISTYPFRNFSKGLLRIFNPIIPVNEERNSLQFRLSRLESVLKYRNIPWYEIALSPFSGTQIFQNAMQISKLSQFRTGLKSDFSPNLIEKYYQQEILPQLYLKKSDNASMANGLELRNPLLHSRMIQFGMSLPEQYLSKNSHKAVIRNYLQNKLPHEVLNSKKSGFSVPLPAILRELQMPDWELDAYNFTKNDCTNIWKNACQGDLNSARAAYSLIVLNSFLRKTKLC